MTPSPDKDTAHPESGELRIEGYRAFNLGIGHERLVDRPSANDSNPRPLADHATATRLLAERDARIAALEVQLATERRADGLWIDEHNRATAVEAEVERLRKLVRWMLTSITVSRECDGSFPDLEEWETDARAALTPQEAGG